VHGVAAGAPIVFNERVIYPQRYVQADQLSLTFAALADPTRRSILTRLAEGEATVNELAEPFAVSLPAISRHLKVLERAGLIVRSREAQWRPSRLQADPLDEAADWIGSRKRTWEARMDRLDPHLRSEGGQHE
jgi:DNA-binding transcriptional ArsR family regulator